VRHTPETITPTLEGLAFCLIPAWLGSRSWPRYGHAETRRKGANSHLLERAVKICVSLPGPICRSTQILGLLVRAAIRRPKLTIALALFVLAALASTLTYTGFLVVGVLADYLGTSRVIAGLLLGALFARFPWMSKGKLRIVGLLPKPVRRPLIVSLLALCLVTFLSRGEYLSAMFPGFGIAFLLTYPWLRRAVFDRMKSSVFKFTGKSSPERADDMVIDGEFREKKNDGLIDR